MNLDLTGKKAFVGGSSQGIGKAVAEELALLGANVTLVARNESRLKTVQEILDTSKGQSHDYIVADFSRPEEVKIKVLQYAQSKRLEEAHILINNTGGPAGGEIYHADIQEFRDAFEMHIACNHLLVQMLTPLMRQANYGRVINIISTSVKEPIPNLGVSNTTRWAVASWAKTMAGELGKHNITVNNVLPGYTATARLDKIIENKAIKSGKSLEEVEENLKSNVPLGRFGDAKEVANAVAFLASPAASYISGTNIVVDGGRTKSL